MWQKLRWLTELVSKQRPARVTAKPGRIRPTLEQLETRLCPVLVESSSPVPIEYKGTKGDDIDVTATAIVSDPAAYSTSPNVLLNIDIGRTFYSKYRRITVPVTPPTWVLRIPILQTGQKITAFIENDRDHVVWDVIATNHTKTRFSVTDKAKLAALGAALAAGTGGASAVLVPLVVAPEPVVTKAGALGIGMLIGANAMLSLHLAKLAADPPDSRFTAIAPPVVPSVRMATADTSLTQDQANAINALIDNQVRALAFARALYTTINRVSGAGLAGNSFWEKKQLQAATKYARQLRELLAAQQGVRTNLVSVLQTAQFTRNVSAADIISFKNEVAKNGLPEFLQTSLRELGADDADIRSVKQDILSLNSQAAAGTYPQKLADASLLSALSSFSLNVDTEPMSLHDVSRRVQATRLGVRAGRIRGQFTEVVTLQNRSRQTIDAPLVLVLNRLAPPGKLLNRDGLARKRQPYVIIRQPGGDKVLRPGERVKIVLRFSAPSAAKLRFQPQVLAGIGKP